VLAPGTLVRRGLRAWIVDRSFLVSAMMAAAHRLAADLCKQLDELIAQAASLSA
jgi:hypothetical protein